ncbi:MAG: type IV pilus biogenesis/stability protein PilW [Enterobacterales bacterium]|nr:type IV pilus biogenesis/stability protein PilW [Enterobacterales bacterium]
MTKSTLKFVCLAVFVAMLAACQTESRSKTSTMGPNRGSSVSNSGFDRQKAAQTRLSAGLQYLKMGNLKNAKRHLDKALELGESSGNVHFGIAYYYEQVKEYSKAEKSYKKALRMDPKNPDFLNGYASFLCYKGQYKKAEKYFNKAVDQPIYAEIASAYVNAGVCAKRAGHNDKAAAYFRKALNRNAKLPVALIEMAQSEFSKNRYRRAFSYIRRYEAVARPTAKSLWLGLRVSHFLKDMDALASYALKLEQLFPDSDETAEFLDHRSQWM